MIIGAEGSLKLKLLDQKRSRFITVKSLQYHLKKVTCFRLNHNNSEIFIEGTTFTNHLLMRKMMMLVTSIQDYRKIDIIITTTQQRNK